MKLIAQSPCRVDLAGGTLDIWPLYLHLKSPVTVNFAVNRYTTCVLTPRNDSRIVVKSVDQRKVESFESFEALLKSPHYVLPLAAYVVRFFAPPMGLDILTNSEAPAGAGISGSSSLIISMCSAFNGLMATGYGLEQIREISQNIEAQIIRVPTGAQDYYPALYGGVSAVELRVDGIRRKAIPVDFQELNRRTVLAYTGVPRNSGINNWEVTKAYIDGDRQVQDNFDRIAAISGAMRDALGAGDWNEVGSLLREEWENRRTNAPGISTPLIDRLVAETREAGALGAKVCGAGGGGCVFFLAGVDRRDDVARVIRQAGAQVLPVTVAPEGVRVETEGD